MRARHLMVVLAAIVLAMTAGACSATSESRARTGPTSQPEQPPGVDPQILSDVAAGAFPMSGRSQLRTIRITLASIGLPNEACGGQGFPDLDDTSFRFDQARYAYLDLIAEKGLSEPDIGSPPRVSQACRARMTPSFEEWHNLGAVWRDATLTAQSSPEVTATFPRTAECLRRESGLEVDAGDPTASYLSAADYALSGSQSVAETSELERKFSAAFARCTANYFDALSAQLAPVKARLVERNRELLERYAAELAALGYVP